MWLRSNQRKCHPRPGAISQPWVTSPLLRTWVSVKAESLKIQPRRHPVPPQSHTHWLQESRPVTPHWCLDHIRWCLRLPFLPRKHQWLPGWKASCISSPRTGRHSSPWAHGQGTSNLPLQLETGHERHRLGRTHGHRIWRAHSWS